MNTLLMLVLATSAPADNPQPLPVGPVNPPPIIVVSDTEWSSEPEQPSRPRLFGRVRNYISHKWTQLTDKVSGNGPTVSPEQVTIQGTTVQPVRMAPQPIRPVWNDSSPEPPLADPQPPQQ